MRRPQYSVQRAQVYDAAAGLVHQHLGFTDSGRVCSRACLLTILFAAAAGLRSLSDTCQRLKRAPSGETVRKALLSMLPGYALLQQQLNRALADGLPRRLRQQRQVLAIDLLLIPYYGRYHTDPQEIWRSQAKAGTRSFHAYGTAYIVHQGRRFTVALTGVQAGQKLHEIVQLLLTQAAQAGVRPRWLLLDRGFFNVAVVRYLQAAHVPFLMAMPCRGRTPDHPRGAGGTQVLCYQRLGTFTRYSWRDEQGRQATVGVCIYRRRRPPRQPSKHLARRRRKAPGLLYAYWGWQPSEARQVAQAYRQRFTIETSYRQVHQARILTTSRKPWVRLFLVGLALLLRNLWVRLHAHWLATPRQGRRRLRLERLRFRTLLLWLQHAAERFLGICDFTTADLPPQPGFPATASASRFWNY